MYKTDNQIFKLIKQLLYKIYMDKPELNDYIENNIHLSFGCHLCEKNQFFLIWLTHVNPKISDANPTYVDPPRNPDYW